MGAKSTRPSDLLNNEDLKDTADQNTNEKEIKPKKKYYGKLYVFLILIVIILQYYNYVFLVMWKRIQRRLMIIFI